MSKLNAFHSKSQLKIKSDIKLFHHLDTNCYKYKKKVFRQIDNTSFSNSSNDHKNYNNFNFTNFIIERTENIHIISLDYEVKKGSFDNLENLNVENFSLLTKVSIIPIPIKLNEIVSKENHKINHDNVLENISIRKNFNSSMINIKNEEKKEKSFKQINSYLTGNQKEIAFKMDRIVDKKLEGLLNLLIKYLSNS